jgi:hypothetical protein
MTKMEGCLIYPFDCCVIGDCTLGTSGHALYFWGYPRKKRNDEAKLAYVSYYEDKANRMPVYSPDQLEYLGLRTNKIEEIMKNFSAYFYMNKLDPEGLAYSTNIKKYEKVEARWPGAQWYFIFPHEDEDRERVGKKSEIWKSWSPQLAFQDRK